MQSGECGGKSEEGRGERDVGAPSPTVILKEKPERGGKREEG